MMNRIFFLAFAALVPACPPAPNVPPDASSDGGPVIVDAGPHEADAGPYAKVCAHLAELGCPEGKTANCAAAFAHAQGTSLTDLKPAELMKAQDKAAVRKVGSVRCP